MFYRLGAGYLPQGLLLVAGGRLAQRTSSVGREPHAIANPWAGAAPSFIQRVFEGSLVLPEVPAGRRRTRCIPGQHGLRPVGGSHSCAGVISRSNPRWPTGRHPTLGFPGYPSYDTTPSSLLSACVEHEANFLVSPTHLPLSYFPEPRSVPTADSWIGLRAGHFLRGPRSRGTFPGRVSRRGRATARLPFRPGLDAPGPC